MDCYFVFYFLFLFLEKEFIGLWIQTDIFNLRKKLVSI